jgi:hypothetical protein
VNNQKVEQVKEFKYLGCYITESMDPEVEVKRRCSYTHASFEKMKKLYTDKSLSLEIRKRLMRCCVWSVMLYGAEATTYTARAISYMEACEMWIYRRMLKIPWTAQMKNSEVLEMAKAERMVLETIKSRKIKYFGRVIRGEKYELLCLIIQGKIKGKRGAG